MTGQRSIIRKALPAGERNWLLVMALVTGVEALWWLVNWAIGFAPTPLLGTYLALAFVGLAVAMLVRAAVRPRAERAGFASLAAGAALIGFGASFFLPLKYAIPKANPFWLDRPLAAAEQALFGTHPWRFLDQALGGMLLPVDRVYALWLPVQTLILFTVMLESPSRAKSRALIAYSLAWLVLGVAAAAIFSSAGPIFYDRLFGGGQFGPLRETLRNHGAWLVLAESDAMWAALASARPGFVAGISAFPSIHVAISLWIFLAAGTMAPRVRPLALGYCIFVWIASVQLGWHYASDGLAGAAGMLVIWFAAGHIDNVLCRLWPFNDREKRGAEAPLS